jgi:F-type H+-transporting ATPase subunit delta
MLTVTVKSAIDLTAAQLDAVKKAVTKKYGKDVQMEQVVDPSILGGVQVLVGSRLIDGSIRGKLNQLKQAIRQQG